MRKFNKLISMLLAVLMMVSSLAAIFTVQVFADETETETDVENDTTTEEGEGDKNTPEIEIQEQVDYTTQIYATPEDKLATMKLALEKDGYQLYVDEYSGEVACVNTKTGEKLFTNPYDVGSSMGDETTKSEILSQISVTFKDLQGQEKTFNSYIEAAKRGQIVTEPIKNGLRVEYTIGREQAKTLVPRLISKERFDSIIMAAALEIFGEDLYSTNPSNEVHKFQKFLTYYVLYSKETLDVTKEEREKLDFLFGGVTDGLINSDRQLTNVLRDYPIVDTMPVYVFDPNASDAEIEMCEELIRQYCPEYTYEELDYDHELTDYTSEDQNPPVFRMALEYKLDGEGLSVRLPANGIRFNETLYKLVSVDVLPYMGAGNSGYEGYNFFPDGSGTLFDFQELNTSQTRSVVGKVYGTDFAYHEITGTYQKTIRYPVFGIVEDYYYYTFTEMDENGEEILSQHKIAGNMVDAINAYNNKEDSISCKGKESALNKEFENIITDKKYEVSDRIYEKHGFVAIIEEGDALASLSTYHAGSLSDYNTIKMSFTPRAMDKYNLKDSISVGSNEDFEVVSSRKYVGGYKVKYLMLSDVEANREADAEKGIADRHDASWFGMAVAYRDYLTKNGVITKNTDEETDAQIPLYIETFGAVETTKKVLSIPVTVMESLTSFEEIIEMYNYLAGQGIKNVNFKLTGYANGGMYASVPGKLKFEKAVGGNDGFQKLLNDVADINASDSEANLGIFPDFDIVYETGDAWFDGYSTNKHAARTIDDRYATKREYSATQQKYINYFELVVSPAYFYVLYERITKNYAEKYDNVTGISVSTLGGSLHSDFDEDEPYNREDSKKFTVEAFEYLDKTYGEIMTEAGNAYVWKYVDHMLDVSLDSSRYNFSANAVPFIGVVLHGSMSFTGEPLNMEGDLQYAVLKAIENGASPYFILSYKNTHILKEYFDLSQYYSIMYDIWQEDIIEVYTTLNNALSDVQNKYIVEHEFLSGTRVPDIDELENDINNEYINDLESEKNKAEIIAKEISLKASEARIAGRLAEAYALEALGNVFAKYATQIGYVNNVVVFDGNYYGRVKTAYIEYEKVAAYASFKDSTDPAEQAKYLEYLKADAILDLVANYNLDYTAASNAYDAVYVGMELNEDDKAAADVIKAAYKKFADAKNDEERATALEELNAALDANSAKADNYFKYLANKSAIEHYLDSGLKVSYDECYNTRYNYEKNNYYFAGLKTAAKKETANENVKQWYDSYAAANDALKALESKVDSYEITSGKVDDYLEALAKRDAYAELGYNTSEDATLVDLYDKADRQAKEKREQAIQATTRVDSLNLMEMQELLVLVNEQLDIAKVAVDVLIQAEGKDDTNIVLQAKDRVNSILNYIENDIYTPIVKGREYLDENGQSVMLNGNALRYERDALGKVYYFYGSYETGYSYFTKVKDAETGVEKFEVYHKGGNNTYDTNAGKFYNGQEVRSFTNENKEKVYYIATVEDGYTYLTINSYYNVYVEIEDVVYDESNKVATVNGVDIFLDGDTYFSKNADGTYTRYNYYKSIAGCVAEATELSVGANGDAGKKAAAFSILADLDAEFATIVQNRIENNKKTNDKEEEEEIEEIESKYYCENIVKVSYGNEDGTVYKTFILNYNNYAVKVIIDGYEYTIPAYEFVTIKK